MAKNLNFLKAIKYHDPYFYNDFEMDPKSILYEGLHIKSLSSTLLSEKVWSMDKNLNLQGSNSKIYLSETVRLFFFLMLDYISHRTLILENQKRKKVNGKSNSP